MVGGCYKLQKSMDGFLVDVVAEPNGYPDIFVKRWLPDICGGIKEGVHTDVCRILMFK